MKDGVGITKQERKLLLVSKAVPVPAVREAALLKVNKAQSGTAVWLNGKKDRRTPACFTAAVLTSQIIQWDGENQLVVRVGAHPGAPPKGAPAGTDFEMLVDPKHRP